MKKFKKTVRMIKQQKKTEFSVLKRGMTMKQIKTFERNMPIPICDRVESFLVAQTKVFKGYSEVCVLSEKEQAALKEKLSDDKNPKAHQRMYNHTRRHSFHYDELNSKYIPKKVSKNSRMSKFMKTQNAIFSRFEIFRHKKYYDIDEINHLEKQRRKSWTAGGEGIELLSLFIRDLAHKNDLNFASKLKPSIINSKRSSK